MSAVSGFASYRICQVSYMLFDRCVARERSQVCARRHFGPLRARPLGSRRILTVPPKVRQELITSSASTTASDMFLHQRRSLPTHVLLRWDPVAAAPNRGGVPCNDCDRRSPGPWRTLPHFLELGWPTSKGHGIAAREYTHLRCAVAQWNSCRILI